ncbi:MAG: tRNA guanosine(34) transglycosylase Tgt [Elusimicrobia bacterium HGW-Elusimicrobia-1]|jgi:queuine tRNA-ribosyltransferase|nr:MAG: tRNA guanosine(34) transglycosylase Tgt [Elusimicrobia bacterium HGW-Elusimicrobia-1]
MKTFEIVKSDEKTKSRLGVLRTPRGEIRTPVFMPVGTQGTVKTLSVEDLEALGAEIILNNAYHMYLRPGADRLAEFGGLHNFISWKKPILTDSGGYQIFSLAASRKITEDGVKFRSHIDGSEVALTPESMTAFQFAAGSDIAMCLDECLEYPAPVKKARESKNLTTRWARRCRDAFGEALAAEGVEYRPGEGLRKMLFGIVQGGMYADLRRESASEMTDIGFDGYAVGGLSVGEPRDVMMPALDAALENLPSSSPRYFMGLGSPEDIWEAVERGVDMFDCVLPTRNARNAQALTFSGRINITNERFRSDSGPLEDGCLCPACRRYSRAFIGHLFRSGEFLAGRLLSLHNIFFMIKLMAVIREAVSNGNYVDEKKKFLEKYLA